MDFVLVNSLIKIISVLPKLPAHLLSTAESRDQARLLTCVPKLGIVL